MIKAIIFDWGGVLAPADNITASKRLAEKYDYDAESIASELKANESRFSTGRDYEGFFAAITERFNIPAEEIKKALNEMPTNEVFEFAKELKSKGVKIFLLSDQMRFRSDYIKEHYDIGFFDEAHFSNKTGFIKTSQDAFNNLLKSVQQRPEECLFIDDRSENVDMAKSVGINAIHFRNIEQLKKEFESFSII